MSFFGNGLPPIIIGEADRHDLLVLALSGNGHGPDAADDLLFELGRARVLPEGRVPSDTVRVGSRVRYTIDDGEPLWGRLAFPHEAKVDPMAISVLSQVGTALLGLRSGQTIRWSTREGYRHRISVLAVSNIDGDGSSRLLKPELA